MAWKARKITVGTEATRIDFVLPDNDPGSSMIVKNDGDVTVWLGGTDVDDDENGYDLEPGQQFGVDTGRADHGYAIVSTGTGTLRVLAIST